MFEIAQSAIERIVEHARSALPDECCGLLIGRGDLISRAFPSANLEPSPTRFVIDPRDHFAAIHAARASGDEILGIYHSHPSAPATPSKRDRAEAGYDECLYLIVSLAGGAPAVRLFRFLPGNFLEVPFVPRS